MSMEKVKVNIKEFEAEYGILIPADVSSELDKCFLKGESTAEIRESVFQEMSIKKFYREHPELCPKTDWEAILLSRHVIDLLKRYINGDEILPSELKNELTGLAITIDSRKVKNEPNLPTTDLQALYDDLLWLRCEILKQ